MSRAGTGRCCAGRLKGCQGCTRQALGDEKPEINVYASPQLGLAFLLSLRGLLVVFNDGDLDGGRCGGAGLKVITVCF